MLWGGWLVAFILVRGILRPSPLSFVGLLGLVFFGVRWAEARFQLVNRMQEMMQKDPAYAFEDPEPLFRQHQEYVDSRVRAIEGVTPVSPRAPGDSVTPAVPGGTVTKAEVGAAMDAFVEAEAKATAGPGAPKRAPGDLLVAILPLSTLKYDPYPVCKWIYEGYQANRNTEVNALLYVSLNSINVSQQQPNLLF